MLTYFIYFIIFLILIVIPDISQLLIEITMIVAKIAGTDIYFV